MKTKSQSIVSLRCCRNGEIINALVLMLVAILLPVWILGTLYPTYFPTPGSVSGSSEISQSLPQSVSGADSVASVASVASVGSAGGAATVIGEGESSDPGLIEGNVDGDFQSRENGGMGELSGGDAAEFEKTISALEKQLEDKSRELEQFRRQSTDGGEGSSDSTADMARFKGQIANLTQQRNELASQREQLADKVGRLEQNADGQQAMATQLLNLTAQRDRLKQQLTSMDDFSKTITQRDQLIKSLNEQTGAQKLKIQALQSQATAALGAQRVAEKKLADIAERTTPLIAGLDKRKRPLEYRDWTSSRGNKARLAFVRWENGQVVVVDEAKQEFQLPLDRLSPNDQTYVNEQR